MSGSNRQSASALPGPPSGGAERSAPRRRYSLLTPRDKLIMFLMVGIPTFLCVGLIWIPTIASFFLSFTNWRGITTIGPQNFVGLKNYEVLFTQYPFFWP